MPLTEDEELELLELEEAEAAEAAPDPGFGPTTSGEMRSPGDVDWLGAIKNEFTKPAMPGEMSVASNPAIATSSPLNAAGGAVASHIASRMGKVAKPAVNLAERFATTPLVGKVAEAVTPSTYMGGGNLARAAGYMTPVVNKAQAAGDALNLAGKGAQKGVAWILDNAPQKLGKFAGVLRKAAGAGANALATTEFLLQQSDPEYQQIKKDLENE